MWVAIFMELCSPPAPPTERGLPSLVLVYSRVSGLTRDPEVGPRWSLQLEGLQTSHL